MIVDVQASRKTTWRRSRAVALLALVSLAACGTQSGHSAGDAGLATDDAGVDASTAPITAPSPPASPVWTCPAGWRQVVVGDDPPTCDPWPEGGRGECRDGEAHYPGEPGCVVVGAACPAGDWPDDLPADRVRHVSIDGSDDADGSRKSPFRSVARAARGAVRGTTIVLGPGQWNEDPTIPAGVTLRGACVTRTAVTGTIETWGADVQVRDLRSGSLWVHAGSDTTATGMWVANGTIVGVQIDGHLEATDLVVTGTAADGSGRQGYGVLVNDGARLELRRAIIAGNLSDGVRVYDGVATVQDVSIRDTHPEPSTRNLGRGVEVGFGGDLTIERAAIEDNLDEAVIAIDGATLTLADVVVRGTRGDASDGSFGRGLSAEFGATVIVTRALFEDNREMGVVAVNPDTTLLLEDVVVRDTRPEEASGLFGYGIVVREGADATLRRVASVRNAGVLLMATLEGELSGEDVALRGPRTDAAGNGYGLVGQDGATITLDRIGVEQTLGVGAFFGCMDGESGGSAELTDLVVRGARSDPATGLLGRSISVECGARVAVRRAVLQDGQEGGAFALGQGSRLRAEDLEVVDVVDPACAEADCDLGAIGLSATKGASVEATHFRVSRISLCGVQVAEGGQMDLHDGAVTDNPIGANVQTEGFDFARLSDGVVYRDNRRNLDAAAMPLPAAAPPPLD